MQNNQYFFGVCVLIAQNVISGLETELNTAHKECELVRQRIRALEDELELYRKRNKQLCDDLEDKTGEL